MLLVDGNGDYFLIEKLLTILYKMMLENMDNKRYSFSVFQ